jgi:hypothetical protein
VGLPNCFKKQQKKPGTNVLYEFPNRQKAVVGGGN